ncbi:MAG: hypothetical protein IJX67_02030 [Oscillospiraceae bacterium]|nr:hypothetical protein [Oscillospiraceae bacterium]
MNINIKIVAHLRGVPLRVGWVFLSNYFTKNYIDEGFIQWYSAASE